MGVLVVRSFRSIPLTNLGRPRASGLWILLVRPLTIDSSSRADHEHSRQIVSPVLGRNVSGVAVPLLLLFTSLLRKTRSRALDHHEKE